MGQKTDTEADFALTRMLIRMLHVTEIQQDLMDRIPDLMGHRSPRHDLEVPLLGTVSYG